MTDPKLPVYDARLENLDASPVNPQRIGRFVKVVRIPRPRMNAGTWWQLTDGRGSFWQVRPDRLRLVPDAGLASEPDEPVMTETTRGLARKVDMYRGILRGLGVDTASLERDGDLSDCPAYFGDGKCNRGCWQEPKCQTGEIEVGWPLARLRWGLRLAREHEEAQRASRDTVQSPTAEIAGWDGAE